MSADLLREAAQRMRELAEAATPGPWEPYPDEGGVSDIASFVPARSPQTLNDGTLGAVAQGAWDGDAAHIASWTPAVALAVADLLDDIATTRERLRAGDLPASSWSAQWATAEREAIVVARRLLRKEA